MGMTSTLGSWHGHVNGPGRNRCPRGGDLRRNPFEHPRTPPPAGVGTPTNPTATSPASLAATTAKPSPRATPPNPAGRHHP